VRVIALSTLRTYWSQPGNGAAEGPVLAWYRHVLKADWASPSDVKADFGSSKILKNGRVVFNLAGNRYRLVVWINYSYRVVYIRFLGSHAEYDLIDSQTI
jgi:mRNA interferase HigB